MDKKRVRIYKAPDGKGKFINKTAKFLQKAQMGAEVQMSQEDMLSQYFGYAYDRLKRNIKPEAVYADFIKSGVPQETAYAVLTETIKQMVNRGELDPEYAEEEQTQTEQPQATGEEQQIASDEEAQRAAYDQEQQELAESDEGYYDDEEAYATDDSYLEDEDSFQYGGYSNNPMEQYATQNQKLEQPMGMEEIIANTPGIQEGLVFPGIEQYLPDYSPMEWQNFDALETSSTPEEMKKGGAAKKNFVKNVMELVKKQMGGEENGKSKAHGKGKRMDNLTNDVENRKNNFVNTLRDGATKAASEKMYDLMMKSGDPKLMQIAMTPDSSQQQQMPEQMMQMGGIPTPRQYRKAYRQMKRMMPRGIDISRANIGTGYYNKNMMPGFGRPYTQQDMMGLFGATAGSMGLPTASTVAPSIYVEDTDWRGRPKKYLIDYSGQIVSNMMPKGEVVREAAKTVNSQADPTEPNNTKDSEILKNNPKETNTALESDALVLPETKKDPNALPEIKLDEETKLATLQKYTPITTTPRSGGSGMGSMESGWSEDGLDYTGGSLISTMPKLSYEDLTANVFSQNKSDQAYHDYYSNIEPVFAKSGLEDDPNTEVQEDRVYASPTSAEEINAVYKKLDPMWSALDAYATGDKDYKKYNAEAKIDKNILEEYKKAYDESFADPINFLEEKGLVSPDEKNIYNWSGDEGLNENYVVIDPETGYEYVGNPNLISNFSSYGTPSQYEKETELLNDAMNQQFQEGLVNRFAATSTPGIKKQIEDIDLDIKAHQNLVDYYIENDYPLNYITRTRDEMEELFNQRAQLESQINKQSGGVVNADSLPAGALAKFIYGGGDADMIAYNEQELPMAQYGGGPGWQYYTDWLYNQPTKIYNTGEDPYELTTRPLPEELVTLDETTTDDGTTDSPLVRRAQINYVPRYRTTSGGLFRTLAPWNPIAGYAGSWAKQMTLPYMAGTATPYAGSMEGLNPVARRVTKTGLLGRPKKWTDYYATPGMSGTQLYRSSTGELEGFSPNALSMMEEMGDKKGQRTTAAPGEKYGVDKETWDAISSKSKGAIKRGYRRNERSDRRAEREEEKEKFFPGGSILNTSTDDNPFNTKSACPPGYFKDPASGLCKNFAGEISPSTQASTAVATFQSSAQQQMNQNPFQATGTNTLTGEDYAYTKDGQLTKNNLDPVSDLSKPSELVGVDYKRKDMRNIDPEAGLNVFNASVRGGLNLLDKWQNRGKENTMIRENTGVEGIYSEQTPQFKGDWVDYGSQLGQYRFDQMGQDRSSYSSYGQKGGFMQTGGYAEDAEVYMTDEEIADFIANGGEIEYL